MIIDTENLDTLSLPEVAVLLMLYDKSLDNSKVVLEVKDTDIRGILDSLENKGYITSSIYATDFETKPPYKHTAWSMVQKGKQALAANCVQDKAMVKIANNKALTARCDALALKLMELYPTGTKPNTTLKWRGNQKAVSEKLKKLIQQGAVFTDEEAIEATKAYISAFNGFYTPMRVLPYFLSKNVIKGGEVEKVQDFLSYVEDLRNNSSHESIDSNWGIALR